MNYNLLVCLRLQPTPLEWPSARDEAPPFHNVSSFASLTQKRAKYTAEPAIKLSTLQPEKKTPLNIQTRQIIAYEAAALIAAHAFGLSIH